MTKLRKTGPLLLGLLCFSSSGAWAQAQHPILDMMTQKVIEKFQASSCEQLANQRAQPKSPMEQHAVQFLRSHPEMRAAFLDRVAAPIANKMFECGLIP